MINESTYIVGDTYLSYIISITKFSKDVFTLELPRGAQVPDSATLTVHSPLDNQFLTPVFAILSLYMQNTNIAMNIEIVTFYSS